jgi:predicted secreted protein
LRKTLETRKKIGPCSAVQACLELSRSCVSLSRAWITEMEKSIIRFIRKNRRPQIAKAILSKMSNAGGYYNTRLQVILWNHSNKTRMVLAQKQVLK